MKNAYYVVLALICLCFSSVIGKSDKFFTTPTPKSADEITVHVVPHTHDDAGWNWTYRDYYYGSASMERGVNDILDSMVENLSSNPNRTFIEVEMAFFEKWWFEQTDATKAKVKQFLKEERLEFINGGWVMHDEAATYYQHLIDQTRLGLMFLKKELNFTPRVAWFIDPFGHSAANAAILANMGFEKIAFVRIDYKEKDIRRASKNLEFQWKPFSQISTYSNTQIFTHITYEHYCLPGSIGEFSDDNLLQYDENKWNEKADGFYRDLKVWNSGFKTNNVMLMYGCDFTHRVKYNNYLNIEKLMEVMKTRHPDMKVIFSTPSKYFKAVMENTKDFSVYENQDFFPYADDQFSYWTGYFTSRPYLKGMVREAGNYLANSSKLLLEYVLDSKKRSNPNSQEIIKHSLFNLYEMRKSLGICQHHDAVAGTAKELVSQDYIRMLDESIIKVKEVINHIVNSLMNLNKYFVQTCISPVTDFYCDKIFSDLDENNLQEYYVYNNGNTVIDQGQLPIHFRLNSSNYKILDSNRKEITTDIFCENIEHQQQLCQAYFNISLNKGKVGAFIVQKINESKSVKGENLKTHLSNNFSIYEDKFVKLSKIEMNNDDVEFVVKENTETGTKQQVHRINLSHGSYISYNGDNADFKPQGSNNDGAYILSTSKILPKVDDINYENSMVYIGSLITQITLSFPDSHMNLRYNPLLRYVLEIESVFNKHDRPNSGDDGKELLLYLKSDINNKVKINDNFSTEEFWTDANGTKMMRRFKDHRTGWAYKVTEPVGSNFYPINYSISIREKTNKVYTPNDYDNLNKNDKMITLLNDRSQSGGAMETGNLMLILNRFSKKDDSRGVDEPIYEQNSLPYNYRVTNWIAFSNYFDKNQIEDHVHQRPTIISVPNNKKLKYEKAISTDFFKFDSCLTHDYYFTSENKVLVQVHNKQDPYFFGQSQSSCSVEFVENKYFKVREVNLNGIDEVKSKKFKNIKKNETKFNVDPLAFRAFEVEFN